MSDQENPDSADALFVAGGLALMVLGAGLLIARPGIRRIVQSGLSSMGSHGENPLAQGLGGVIPDFERYFKIKSM
jgi:hypothetical protein